MSVSAAAEELPDSKPHFHRVEARVVPPKPGIRDVQVARFQTPVIFRREDVRTERCGRCKIHVIRSRGYVVVGDEKSTVEFEVGREASVAFEIPLQSERTESYSIGSIRGLEDEKGRGGVEGVLKASSEKAGKMRPGKDPSITQAGVE